MTVIVSKNTMQAIEARAIAQGETIPSLMERAGAGVALIAIDFVTKYKLTRHATIFIGKGNNGGDALVAAQVLLQSGFTVLLFTLSEESQPEYIKRLEQAGAKIKLYTSSSKIPLKGIIIDGIFGIGYRGDLPHHILMAIDAINMVNMPVIAIDIPSGLDATTGAIEKTCVQATITVAMEYVKTGSLFLNGWNYSGTLIPLQIGLEKYRLPNEGTFDVVQEEMLTLPQNDRNQHKYSRGHVALVAGSSGMSGAAFLAASAALEANAGIVHLLYPKALAHEFFVKPFEVIGVPFDTIEEKQDLLKKASSRLFGPGLGPADVLLETLFTHHAKKVILDADALNWFSRIEHKEGLLQDAILTPHHGEMHRLLGFQKKKPFDLDFIEACQDFTQKEKTHLILKGAPTVLFLQDTRPKVLLQGDPSMATAGSGDVLSGILAALLAKLSFEDTMLLGTFLHARAGEIARKTYTPYAVTAKRILEAIPEAWKSLLYKTPWRMDLS